MENGIYMNIQEYIQTEHSGLTFENVYGREFWKKILGSYASQEESDEALGLENVQNFLLFGPFGSGKTTLLLAQAGEMISAGYQYLEVNLKKTPENILPQLVDYILQHYLAQQPCYLYLDHIELLTDSEPLYDLYNQAAENEYYLIMAAAAEDETGLNPDIRKLFAAYYVGLPDEGDRKAYLEAELESLFEHASLSSMRTLLEGTEGYSYIQLDAVIRQIKLRVKYRVLAGEAKLENAMNMLKPELIEEVLANKQPVVVRKHQEGMASEDLTAILQALTAVQPAVKEEKLEEKPEEKAETMDPLEALRAKYSPKKVFDQGVYLTKGRN